MRTSDNGINFIKRYEGCVLKVYLDCVNVKTLGYGHTGADVNALAVGTPITQAQADAYLSSDLVRFENNVTRYDSIYHWTQNEFDALVSFAFNVGSIDQLTNNGTRSKEEIANKMLLYNKAGGKVNTGLTNRRKAEQAMFLQGTAPKVDSYEVGQVYTTQANLYIRQEPMGEKIKHGMITDNAKAHSTFDEYGNAILQKGTRVTCIAVQELVGSTWVLIPSGWICAKNTGKTYLS